MRRFIWIGLLVVALAVGFRLGRTTHNLPDWVLHHLAAILGVDPTAAAPEDPVIYYRDPDGKPVYAAEPRKTPDGRDFVPFRATGDVSFEDKPTRAAGEQSRAGTGKRIRHYRNPMGLPDTSPTPKKDSMGWTT